MSEHTTTIELTWFDASEVGTDTLQILDDEALEQAWKGISEGYREGEILSTYLNNRGDERAIRGWWRRVFE